MTQTKQIPDRRLAVAPMMDWTDRHERYFLRLLSRRTLLYTEMVTSGAILFGDRARFLALDPAEHPVALQLGGADPKALAAAAAAGEEAGFDEINLNVGCPSDRVQNARFGACLMAEPALVARAVEAMRAAVNLPVTVKCRIGVDERDGYEDLRAFVETVAAAGCETFIVHARKAWLTGLSPKENREIPPLRYELVHRLKEDLPELEVILNGGLQSLEQAVAERGRLDGVMIGRAAYQNPYILAEADRRFFGETAAPPTRRQVAEAMIEYLRRELAAGVPLKSMTRHILGLYNGLPGARAWRRALSGIAQNGADGLETVENALDSVEAARQVGWQRRSEAGAPVFRELVPAS